ncbi:hypothetical protein QP185_01250 [Sphingomonas aerolata]|uniref:hypothetical protein n=1 Tax=Sphingomonas aerolata TaxID=185951 RepID=UPI002FE22BFD
MRVHPPVRLYPSILVCLGGGVVVHAAGSTQAMTRAGIGVGDDIVIAGQRSAGSAVEAIDPTATLDQAGIQSPVRPISRRCSNAWKPLTTSASGGDPVYLLNGRRMSSMNELCRLPQEAMEKIEVLPESEAARFGLRPPSG